MLRKLRNRWQRFNYRKFLCAAGAHLQPTTPPLHRTHYAHFLSLSTGELTPAQFFAVDNFGGCCGNTWLASQAIKAAKCEGKREEKFLGMRKNVFSCAEDTRRTLNWLSHAVGPPQRSNRNQFQNNLLLKFNLLFPLANLFHNLPIPRISFCPVSH